MSVCVCVYIFICFLQEFHKNLSEKHETVEKLTEVVRSNVACEVNDGGSGSLGLLVQQVHTDWDRVRQMSLDRMEKLQLSCEQLQVSKLCDVV